MNFVSINECDKFAYRDSRIVKAHFLKDELILEVEALIVRRDNSQNSNYTDSYAGLANVIFRGSRLNKIIKLGYKRFDADDRLIEEIKDEELGINAFSDDKKLISLLEDAFLTNIRLNSGEDKGYIISIEIAGDDPSEITDEYELELGCDEMRIEWDKYMNRVQEY